MATQHTKRACSKLVDSNCLLLLQHRSCHRRPGPVREPSQTVPTLTVHKHLFSSNSSQSNDALKDFKELQDEKNKNGSSTGVLQSIGSYIPNFDAPKRVLGQIPITVRDAIREKIKQDTSRLSETYQTTKSHLKKKERQWKKKEEEIIGREHYTFEKHISDMNDSIMSYYDTEAVEQARIKQEDKTAHGVIMENKNISAQSSTGTEEEAGWGRIFASIAQMRPMKSDSQTVSLKKPIVRPDFVSKRELDQRMKDLTFNLRRAASNASRLKRAEEFCSHLMKYPDCRTIAIKEKVLPFLLKLRTSKDKLLQAQAYEALALIGYAPPPKGRGIRILTIDGGGTRGLVGIETLKKLERLCKTELCNQFDYVCGVSTGGLVAVLALLFRVPLDECEQLYLEMSRLMFTRSKFVGTGKLVWSHAFYDTDLWEEILRNKMGEKAMIDFAKDPQCPKMSVISNLTNVHKLKNFMFRNYNLPHGVYSHYPGNCKHKVWEAIRASSAAPGYFEAFSLGDYVHQDGGLLTNNPTAVAIHEAKLLWPDENIQCLISVGNGRYEPNIEYTPSKGPPLKDMVMKIVDSATDTEAVHHTMKDMLPKNTYYRFNPYLTEDSKIDEINPDSINQMQEDIQMYLRKNEHKVDRAARQLLLPRLPHQKLMDQIRLTAEMASDRL